MTDPQVELIELRALGETEARFRQLHTRYAGTGQVVVALSVSCRPNDAELARTVESLLARYRVLRAQISVVGARPRFVEPSRARATTSYLQITTLESEDEAWAHVESSISTPLDGSAALWRLDAFLTPTGAVLALAFHHAAVDGAGAKQVAGDLLGDLDGGRPPSSPSGDALPPPLDAAQRVSDLPRPPPPHGRLAFEATVPVAARKTASLRVSLDRRESKALTDVARSADVTLHALLVAMFAAGSAEAAAGLPLVVSTGLVLREIVTSSRTNTGLGCWATEVTIELPAANELTELARQYQRALLKASLKVTTRPAEWSERDIAAGMSSEDATASFSKGLSVVNMGAVGGSDAKLSRHLSELWIFRNCSGGQHSLVVTVVELHSRLWFSICYPLPLISHASAKAIVMRVLNTVEALTSVADSEQLP